MSPQILKLDVAGSPADWIEFNEAVHYYATAWWRGQSAPKGSSSVGSATVRLSSVRDSRQLDRRDQGRHFR